MVYIGELIYYTYKDEFVNKIYPCDNLDQAKSLLERKIAKIIESPNKKDRVSNAIIRAYECGELKETFFYDFLIDASITLKDR